MNRLFSLDVLAAWRGLRRAPAFTLAATLTVALGVAAGATIFSFVRGFLLAPLPYHNADRLVLVETVRGEERGKLSTMEVRDLDREATRLVGVASFRLTQYTASGDGRPEVFPAAMSTYRIFEVLGLPPMLGAGWPAADDGTRQFKVVISDRLWRQRYRADPGIIGKPITLDVYQYTVIGVMPPEFDFPAGADIWRRPSGQDFESRAIRSASAVARLAPGASVADAQRELDALAARYAEAYPDTNRGVGYRITPLRDYWIGELRPYLLALIVAVALVFGLATINVLHLALVRIAARRRELALRVALGAAPSTLVKTLATEGVLIGLLAAVIAAAVVPVAMTALDRLVPFARPAWMIVRFDWATLLIGFVLALAAATVATAWPAWRAVAGRDSAALRSGNRTAGGSRARGLPLAQIALGSVVVVGAVALAATVARLRQVDLGFDPTRLLAVKIDPPWTGYNTVANTAPFYRRVLEALAAEPSIVAAASNVAMPYATQDPTDGMHRQVPRLPEQSPDEVANNPFVNLQIVSPGYFETLAIPILAGRSFDQTDDQSKPPVAVVGQSLARRLWPGQDPVGRRITFSQLDGNYRPVVGAQDSGTVWYQVAGIAGDIRQAGVLAPPTLDLYLSHEQAFAPETYLVMRTRDDPARAVGLVRQAVERADPLQTIFDVLPLAERIERTYWRQRLAQVLLLAFANLTAVLAAVGVSGVIGAVVARRLPEFGIRLALGANPRALRIDVLRAALLIGAGGAAIGLAVGLSLVAVLARFVEGIVVPGVLTGVVVLVGAAGVAVLASWPPAAKAGGVDPLTAMRSE